MRDTSTEEAIDKCLLENAGSSSWLEPVNKFLVWSSKSLREVLAQGPSKTTLFTRNWLSEGIEKTYPTDVFTRALAKELAQIFRLEEMLVGKTLDSGDILHWTKSSGFRIVEDPDDQVFKKSTPKLLLDHYAVDGRVSGSTLFQLALSKSSIDKNVLEAEFTVKLKHLMDKALSYGYFYVVHEVGEASKDGVVLLSMMFEARFTKSFVNVGRHLWHLTPASNESKIFKQGLVPKSKSANGKIQLGHPDRVYLFTTDDMNVLTQFVRQAAKQSKKFDKQLGDLSKENKYTVIEVDVSKVKSLKLYRDPTFKNLASDDEEENVAVFTYNNIPPEALKVVKRFKLKGSLEEEDLEETMRRSWW